MRLLQLSSMLESPSELLERLGSFWRSDLDKDDFGLWKHGKRNDKIEDIEELSII